MVGKRAPTAERFLEKFERGNPNGCWEWQASTNGAGYGMIWSPEQGRKVLAHRFSYEHFTGRRLRPSDVVRHSCDNPACVNPAHLEAGTQKQNMEDAAWRERVGNTMLTAASVVSMRKAYVAGEPAADIAERFGMARTSVNDVVGGRSWTHLLGRHGCPTLDELKAAAAKNTRNNKGSPEGRKLRSDNSTGVQGINFDKGRSKYLVRVTVDGKAKNIGRFASLDDAIAARAAYLNSDEIRSSATHHP